jgi:hypothetical protein
LIAWLLRELEKNPANLFRKKDLTKKLKKQFEKLKRQGFLAYCQPDPHHETYPCTLPCSNSCPMEVVPMEGKLFAICPKDTEVDPIPLTKEDISKYRVNLDKVIEAIRQANCFAGIPYVLTSRLHFIGERVVDNLNTAFILALFPNVRTAEPHLLSLLARIPSGYQKIVVITPSLRLTQASIYAKLRAASITPVVFSASFGQRDYRISYLAALRKRLPARVSSEEVDLTDNQYRDYEQHAYLCRDHLHIPGTVPRQRSNEIQLNGSKLSLGDSLFALLLRLVVELKKEKGGWISRPSLYADGIISDVKHYQPYSNLRSALKGSLKGKDGKMFIEASGSKRYRISTHPDFVTYDKARLLNHPDFDIRDFTEKLP